MFSEDCLKDMKNANDIGFLGFNPSKIQITIDNLNSTAAQLGMCLETAKLKLLLQDWLSSNPNLGTAGEPFKVTKNFACIWVAVALQQAWPRIKSQ